MKLKYLWFDGHLIGSKQAGSININKFDLMPDDLKIETLIALRYLNSVSALDWNSTVCSEIKATLQRIKNFQEQYNNSLDKTLVA